VGNFYSIYYYHVKNILMHIVQTIQKNLGFSSLEKIDPNTQQAPGKDHLLGNNALAQAAIPAILLGILNHLEHSPDLETLQAEPPASLLDRIFGKTADDVVRQIEEYSKNRDKNSLQELEHIASESLRVIRDSLGVNPSESSIRRFVANNKRDTLLYLPPSLDLGTLLHNNNLDDRTGKMEGPVSSFMHFVENTFNSSGKN
jgi:hypothetical protein